MSSKCWLVFRQCSGCSIQCWDTIFVLLELTVWWGSKQICANENLAKWKEENNKTQWGGIIRSTLASWLGYSRKISPRRQNLRSEIKNWVKWRVAGGRKKCRQIVQPMQELRTWRIWDIENHWCGWREKTGGMRRIWRTGTRSWKVLFRQGGYFDFLASKCKRNQECGTIW